MNQHVITQDRTQVANAMRAYLRRNFEEGKTFTLLSLKQKFTTMSANEIGGIVGVLARHGSVKKTEKGAGEYVYVKAIPGEYSPAQHTASSEADRVFAKQPLPKTAMADAFVKAAMPTPIEEPAPAPAAPTPVRAPAADAPIAIASETTKSIRVTGLFTLSEISESLLEMASIVSKAIPDLRSVPDSELIAEMQRRLIGKSN